MEKVKVPKDVFEGITAVRDSGLTNMLDVSVVIRLAKEMRYDEAARWIQENKRLYAELIFHGGESEQV
jgi:hypothetical protein